MPPEKLTGKGTEVEWPTFEERDSAYESMRKKAISMIDPIDLLALGNQADFLNKILSPDEIKKGELSPLIKSVIKGLFNNPDARDYLFPEHVQSESDLIRFIEEAIGGKNDTARNFMDFVLLAVRSGITLVAEANLYKDHIKKKISSYILKLFEEWKNILEADIEDLTEPEKAQRARLLVSMASNKSLHSEIFNKLANGTSMDIFCFYLRRLEIENAGYEVEKIMKDLLDNQLGDSKKEFMEFLDKKRKEGFKKRRETVKGIGEISKKIVKGATLVSFVPDKSTENEGEFGNEYFEKTTEIVFVNPEKIPSREEKEGRKRAVLPTAHFKMTGEITDVYAPAPDKIVEEVPPEPACVEIKIEEITLPQLPALSFDEKEIVEEENPKKRMGKMKAWIADNPKSIRMVVLGLALSVTGGALYVSDLFSGKKESKKPGSALNQNYKGFAFKEQAREQAAPLERQVQAARQIPLEVKKADLDLMSHAKQVQVESKTDQSKADSPVDTSLAGIDARSIDNLKDGIYKDMWAGKSFDVKDAPFSSISGFMEKQLKEMINGLESKKDRNLAMRKYYSELRELEKGWLLYMSIQEAELSQKKDNLTSVESERLNNWQEYKKTHRARGGQAKWLYNNYLKLKESGKKQAKYYNELLERGRELMDGLSELNPDLSDPNKVAQGQQVKFSDGKKVLKTFWRFAGEMKLPMPKAAMGSTGELETPEYFMHAENNDLNSVSPPPIPEDAKVHNIDDGDIVSVERIQPTYGMGKLPELKPILAKIPPAIPEDARVHEIREEDIVEITTAEPASASVPPPIPEDAKIPSVPMYGAGPLKKEIKPILADMMKSKSAKSEVEKPGLWGKMKGWLKKAA